MYFFICRRWKPSRGLHPSWPCRKHVSWCKEVLQRQCNNDQVGTHLELKMDERWSVLDAMERPWMMVVQPGASRTGASTATRLCSSCTPATASASCTLTT